MKKKGRKGDTRLPLNSVGGVGQGKKDSNADVYGKGKRETGKIPLMLTKGEIAYREK